MFDHPFTAPIPVFRFSPRHHTMSLNPPKGPLLPTPHHTSLVVASMVSGLIFNLLPWQVNLLWLRPDFLFLTVMYWAIYRPQHIGVRSAWWLGLIEDLVDGAHLGQHALAYAISIYVLSRFQRRLYNFPPWQQMLPVFALLLIEQLVDIIIAGFVGESRGELKYLFASLTGTVCWLPIWFLLHRSHTPAAVQQT